MHEVITTETRKCKKRVMNNILKLSNKHMVKKIQMKKKGMEDNKLPKWLESKIDFNEPNKLINDIRTDTNNVEVS